VTSVPSMPEGVVTSRSPVSTTKDSLKNSERGSTTPVVHPRSHPHHASRRPSVTRPFNAVWSLKNLGSRYSGLSKRSCNWSWAHRLSGDSEQCSGTGSDGRFKTTSRPFGQADSNVPISLGDPTLKARLEATVRVRGEGASVKCGRQIHCRQ
jgi:hypothetical protein